MKFSKDKNLAFADQPKPILFKDLKEKVKSRRRTIRSLSAPIELRMTLPTAGRPSVDTMLADEQKVVLKIDNFKIGQHAFPPDVKTKGIRSLGVKSRTFTKALISDAFVPEHLDLRPLPKRLPPRLKAPPFFNALQSNEEQKSGRQATTIFTPDDRIVFNDTSYPWGACGRVDTPLGQSSSVMVGPRHLLTVSHAIQWNNDGTAGWVRFRPGYFAPSTPFGSAWAVRTYYKYKVKGPTIDWIEGMYDYVALCAG